MQACPCRKQSACTADRSLSVLLSLQTAEDVQHQQAATEARRAKEAAAAAAALIDQQRAAAATAARDAPAQPRQERRAAVSKLKSSLQQRRRTSASSGSQQAEAPAAGVPAAPQLRQEQAAPPLPAVVLGIPVLPPPPPALAQQPQALPTIGAHQAPAAAVPEQQHTAADAQAVELAAVPAAAGAPPEQPAAHAAAAHAAYSAPAENRDALLQLIQQAEGLKAALQQASSGGSGSSAPGASALCDAVAAAASAPRLPNLLLPPPSDGGAGAASSGLSAATAALLAAAKALRQEGEQLRAPAPSSALPPVLAAAPLPLAPSALAALAAAGDSSDAESDAEDALLQSLFFRPTSQQQPSAAASSAGAEAGQQPQQQGVAPAAQPQAPLPAPQLVVRVQLQGLQLAEGSDGSVRCVVKPLQAGGPPQQLTVPVTASNGGAACHVEAPLPASADEAWPPALPPYLFLELWRHSGDLLGVAKVPLLQPGPSRSSSGGAGGDLQQRAAVVAEGRHAVHNILEGRDAGSLHVAAVLQARGAPPRVAAVRHALSVRICSAHRLPSAAAYAAAGLRAPDARVLHYSFPGAEAQRRGVCAWGGRCVAEEGFADQLGVCCLERGRLAPSDGSLTLPTSCRRAPGAADGRGGVLQQPALRRRRQPRAGAARWAQHPAAAAGRVRLAGLARVPAITSSSSRSCPATCEPALSSLLATIACASLPLPPRSLLRFELFDCWADQQQRQQHGWALLQLSELGSLVAEAERGSSGAGGAPAASRQLLLPLCTEYDSAGEAAADAGQALGAGTAAQRGPSLKIELSYTAHLCTIDAAQACEAEAEAVVEAEPAPAVPQPAAKAAVPAGGSPGCDSDGENRRQLANRSNDLPHGRQVQQQQATAVLRPPPDPVVAFVPATLSVEIVRASGLAAAVREAVAAAGSCGSGGGGGAGSLARVAVVGPHAFARLALFAEGALPA